MDNYETYFLNIEDVTVNGNIVEEKFYCDLEKCKGACCTIEDAYGAPLTESEAGLLNKLAPSVFKYLNDACKNEIEKYGPVEIIKGNFHTRTVNGKECVFVYWDNDIAKCALEKAFLLNEIDFRKPVSCYLFPIRRNKFYSDVLRAELLKICTPAFEKGKQMNTPVYEFCKDSLIQTYGKSWYDKLKKEIKKLK